MNEQTRSQYRLPIEVDAWLKDVASKEGRSKNSMMVAVLRQKMESQKENAQLVAASQALG